ncbi:profilin, required for normal timing of actin polymerization in response to thermal stress [Balamuthia mandrillaris]
MSWQTYVDTNLVGTGAVTKGAIFGLDGSQWAVSPGFQPSAAEVKALIAGFSDNNSVRTNGLTVAGTKYLTIRADDRSIYGKKGATGVTCVKTTKAVLVGLYDDKIQPGQCANVVERLADYLIGQGY